MADITITLTAVGSNQGPLFNLYSDVDGFSSPYEENIDQNDLENGYVTSAPEGAQVIRICGTGEKCSNCLDVYPKYTTTTTSTTTTTI